MAQFNVEEKQWDELRRDVRECLRVASRIETLWNGGPGGWPNCLAHTAQVGDHEKRLRYIEERIMRAIGAVAVISILAALASIVNLVERIF